jgi:hypothetical protein
LGRDVENASTSRSEVFSAPGGMICRTACESHPGGPLGIL